MARVLRITTIVLLLALAAGICLLGLAVLAGVAAGGVPYPDGPNAGHLSEPGFGRWLENASFAVSPWAFLLSAGSLAGLVVLAFVWLTWRWLTPRPAAAPTH
jgi:hypothetical protein